MKVEEEIESFLAMQQRSATGLRLEQLHKDLTGTRKLLEAVLWPVFRSFEHMILEYEIVSDNGMKIYVDVFYEPLAIAFESEGFVAHAENITRDRFSFERMRVRSLAAYGYKYFPFTWDEMDKKANACRRAVFELLGCHSVPSDSMYASLSVYEREVIRTALRLNEPFRLSQVSDCLHIGPEPSRKVLRSLMEKKLIRPLLDNRRRHHLYVLESAARGCLI